MSPSERSGRQGRAGVGLAVVLGGALGLLSYRLSEWYRQRRRLLKQLPGPEAASVILVGHEAELRQAGGLGKYLLELHSRHGRIVRFVLYHQLFVSISDPKVLSWLNVLSLDKPISGLAFLRGLLGPRSIGYMIGTQAKHRRMLFHKLFTDRALDALMPEFTRCIHQHVDKWPKAPHSFDAQSVTRPLWMALNALNVFGEQGCEGGTMDLLERFAHALNLLLQERFAPTPAWPLSKRWRRKRQAVRDLHRDVDRVMDAHLSRRGDVPSVAAGNGQDLLSLLLREYSKDPKTFTRDDVHDEITTFLFATFENYVVLSNTLYHLAKHPDVQQRMREEADQVLGSNVDPQSLSDLSRLPYARAVVKESLRASPVGTQTWRLLDSDKTVTTCKGECTLPRGTSIVVPMVAIHRDPNLWKDPQGFDPSRFIVGGTDAHQANGTNNNHEGSTTPREPLAFIPFGLGLRRCLGYRFAQDISCLVILTIVRRHHVEALNEPEWLESTFNWFSKEGIHIRLTPLKNAGETAQNERALYLLGLVKPRALGSCTDR